MDPNATLAELRDLANTVGADFEVENFPSEIGEMVELFQALDHWLTTGGHPPADWE